MKTIIWTYWENPPGLNTPEYMQLCFDTMFIHCNTNDFEFRLLDKQQLYELLPNLRSDLDVLKTSSNPRENISVKTDYTRAKLLQLYGGIWLDADTIVMKPPTKLLELLQKYDFIYREQHEGLAAVNVMGSIPNGIVINEYVDIQDQLLDTTSSIKWAQNGAHMLSPIVSNHPNITKSLGLIGPITFPNWKLYFEHYKHHSFNSNVWSYQLYNKVFPDEFKCRSREDILLDSSLIGKLFRTSLYTATEE